MKIKIDRGGFLFIERAGKMKEQLCPFSSLPECFSCPHSTCGDWCPMFGETVEADRKYHTEGEMLAEDKKTKRVVWIDICQRHLCVDREDFNDERGEK